MEAAEVVIEAPSATLVASEEVIVDEFDEGWNRNMPVKLFTYRDGAQDLHRQTGPQFREHVKKAALILDARGLEVGPPEDVGPTGMYMSVWPKGKPPAHIVKMWKKAGFNDKGEKLQ